MKTTKIFLLLAVFFSVNLFLMQGYAQDIPQTPASSDGVTITEKTQADGTLIETIQISKTPDLKYHGMFDFEGYLPDIIAPTITLSLGQKMILNLCPESDQSYSYYHFFYFDPKKNNLSVVTPERGDASLLKREWMTEPFVSGSCMEYCKIWTTEKTGSDVLSLRTTVTYNAGMVQNWWTYKMNLEIPIVVVDSN